MDLSALCDVDTKISKSAVRIANEEIITLTQTKRKDDEWVWHIKVDPNNVSNYKPITAQVSKGFEYDLRLRVYFEYKKVIVENQHGFQKSTQTTTFIW